MSAVADPVRAAETTGTDGRWRILLVDDSDDDAELIGIELAHAGVDAECRRVDGEAALLDALRSFAPQLVLSDINMPGFSGERAIELVRTHAPGVRFVFISGEPVDVTLASDAAFRADARLSKDAMGQLAGVVRRLLGS